MSNKNEQNPKIIAGENDSTWFVFFMMCIQEEVGSSTSPPVNFRELKECGISLFDKLCIDVDTLSPMSCTFPEIYNIIEVMEYKNSAVNK